MVELVIAIVVGVVSGVASSLITWWLLFHVLAPRLIFAEFIAKQQSERSPMGYDYEFKLENSRSRRAINVNTEAYVFLPDYPKSGGNTMISVPINAEHELAMFQTTNVDRVRRTKRLQIESDKFLKAFSHPETPDNIKLRAHDKKLTLEDLLEISSEAYIRIVATATDSLTGSIKSFKSKDYRRQDIVSGTFIRNSMSIQPE